MGTETPSEGPQDGARTVDEIWIEAEGLTEERSPLDDSTDVLVTLGDGTAWSATFVSFANVESLRRTWRKTGECLGGQYLWAADLVLVDSISRESVEAVVEDLLTSGEFEEAFAKVGEDAS